MAAMEGAPPPEHPPPPPPPPHWGYPPPGSGYPPPPWGHPGQPVPRWAPAVPAQVGSGRFRSMGVGELLDATFSLYRRNFLLIAAISAIVQVPYGALSFLLFQVTGANRLLRSPFSGFTFTPGQSQEITQQQVNDLLNAFAGFLAVTLILALVSVFIVLPLATAATTRAVSDRYLDRDASVGAAYGAALRRLRALIWQSLILIAAVVVAYAVLIGLIIALTIAGGAGAGLGALVLFVIAVVPFLIFVYVRTSLAVPAIVLENVSGWRGLKRSWSLVRGVGWRMLGIRLLVLLITGLISGVLVALISIAGIGLDLNGQLAVRQAASAVAQVFVGPVTYIAVTLLYYDTRIRKEGFDIEMLAQSL